MTDPGQTSAATPAEPDLQFDHVASAAGVANDETTASSEGIRCSACGSTILDEYYSAGDKPICATCRTSIEATRASSRTAKAFGKALIFGLGAALAGAAVYYAVIALLDLEIGIVAILIGWMVGRAIQKALPGGGLRRYQVLAAVLTYFAVGMAYLPLMFGEMKKERAATKQDSTAVVAQQGKSDASPAVASKTGAEEGDPANGGSIILGIGALIVVAFSLPVAAAFSSGGGILSALIIGLGIHQAWRMSGAPALTITGPFRVGGNAIGAGAS